MENSTDTAKQWRAEVILLEPEIPQNTGSIGRTCAALGCHLHLIEPLGFSLEDKYRRRAGLDYWHLLKFTRHPNLESFFQNHQDGVYWFMSKKATRFYHEADFRFPGPVYLVFGKETVGLPESLLTQYPDRCLRIPIRKEARSLNLSNAVALTLFEAHRQNNFPGLL